MKLILQAFQVKFGDNLPEGKVIEINVVEEGLEFILKTSYGYTSVTKGETENVEVERN